MKGMRLVLVSGLLLTGSCLSPNRQAFFPRSEQQRTAKQVLEFHEDRFLLDHNEKLAACWKDYVEARQRLADLWKARSRSVTADAERDRAEREEIRRAKAALMDAARRLQQLSRDMAGEADKLLRAADKIPPLLTGSRR